MHQNPGWFCHVRKMCTNAQPGSSRMHEIILRIHYQLISSNFNWSWTDSERNLNRNCCFYSLWSTPAYNAIKLPRLFLCDYTRLFVFMPMRVTSYSLTFWSLVFQPCFQAQDSIPRFVVPSLLMQQPFLLHTAGRPRFGELLPLLSSLTQGGLVERRRSDCLFSVAPWAVNRVFAQS